MYEKPKHKMKLTDGTEAASPDERLLEKIQVLKLEDPTLRAIGESHRGAGGAGEM